MNTRSPAQTVLFVSGLRPGYRATDLAYEFERFGRLVRCDIPAPPIRNGQPPRTCYAFVEFEQSRDAAEAYHHMHDRRIEDQILNVQWAKNSPSSNWRFDGEVRPDQMPPTHALMSDRRDGARSRSPLPERRPLDRDPRDMGRMPPMRMDNRGGDLRMSMDREPMEQAPYQDRYVDRYMEPPPHQRGGGFDRYGGSRETHLSPPPRSIDRAPMDRYADRPVDRSSMPIGRDRYIAPAHQYLQHQQPPPPSRYDARDGRRARSRSPPPSMHRSAPPPSRHSRDDRYGADIRDRDTYGSRNDVREMSQPRARPYEQRSDFRDRDRENWGVDSSNTVRKVVDKHGSASAPSSVGAVDSVNPNGWDDYRDRSKSRSPRD